MGEGAGFDSPFELARGALSSAGDQLVLNAVLGQFFFQGRGGKHSADGVDVLREDLAVRQGRRQLPQVGLEGLGPLDISRSGGWRLAGSLLIPLRQRPGSRGTPTPLLVDCQEHPSANRAEAGKQLRQSLGVGEKLIPGQPRKVFFAHPRYELPDRVEAACHAAFANLCRPVAGNAVAHADRRRTVFPCTGFPSAGAQRPEPTSVGQRRAADTAP